MMENKEVRSYPKPWHPSWIRTAAARWGRSSCASWEHLRGEVQGFITMGTLRHTGKRNLTIAGDVSATLSVAEVDWVAAHVRDAHHRRAQAAAHLWMNVFQNRRIKPRLAKESLHILPVQEVWRPCSE